MTPVQVVVNSVLVDFGAAPDLEFAELSTIPKIGNAYLENFREFVYYVFPTLCDF